MPHKALTRIAGLPLLEHVRQRAMLADVGPVVIATDDDTIATTMAGLGAEVVRTGAHSNGTLRVSEAAAGHPSRWILNVQGDQPLVDPAHIRWLAQWTRAHDGIATVAARWPTGVAVDDRHRVKVWIAEDGRARNFSREALHPGAHLHLGLYGFTRAALARVTSLPVSGRARDESLEQLTWFDAGEAIFVGLVDKAAPPVDSPEQLAEVRRSFGD